MNLVTFEILTAMKKNWKELVDRMSFDRIPKMILKYQPKEKRNLGRPLKRWKDSVL
jgi:ABC-type antimicrobial peptide transport system ATPase subunit